MPKQIDPTSSAATVERVSSPHKVLPFLLLVTFVAFREFSLRSLPNAAHGGPHSSIPAKHDTNLHHPGCSIFKTSSMGDLWRDMQGPIILNSTYLPNNSDSINKNTTDEDEEFIRIKMVKWTQNLMEYHTPERLRRSLGNRPPSSSILRILSIISDYPTTKVPLKILVTGGSVTAGHWCIDNPVGWDGGDGGAPFKDCAWPSRLERHLRQMFFNDPDVPGILVYNMAVGATSVDVATMILEYEMLPGDLLSPDVILLAHSPNDANMLKLDQLFYTHLNNAVQAAKRLRACDDDLPLVGIVDDNVGMENISQAFETTARYYATASWYQLMMINYGNVVRHTLLQRYQQNRTEPLLGGRFQIHGGMGFHISLAWTVVFNIISLMVEACYDFKEHEDTQKITSKQWEDEAKLNNLEDIPWGSTPSKEIGGIYQTSDPYSVNREWLNNLKTKEHLCRSFNVSENQQPVCTYAWMINKLAGIMRPRDIDRAMKSVMKSSNGWEAAGHFYSYPRLGYYANSENANFYLEIPVTAPTLYFTVLSTESYGPNFIDTCLHIGITIGDDKSCATYNISGYHEIKASPLISHKFQLPRVAHKGEVIHFNATLTSGAYFKIAGLAFCKQ
ncbi:hypothetical protein HJC23_010207 [Cyclotella cryptica]|uniref:Uncharacterized protein n=1 Tax=Cyclotella cryptica TaxID=29204 RepID=A0ABD3PH24_9STRA|eukprot:CCRYP_014722-RA/>CCRYP_014722-RA protein AED:0.40 eAED:0.40 QI:0/-1/0/1/-1/1/1/0/616